MRMTTASPDPVSTSRILLQVGLHIAVKPGVTVDHLLNLGHRLVIVDIGIDADPVLAEINTDDLVHDEGLPDVLRSCGRLEWTAAHDCPES